MRSYLLDYQTDGPDQVTFLRAPKRPPVTLDDLVRAESRTSMPALRNAAPSPVSSYDVIGIAATMLAVGFCLGYYLG